VRELWPGFIAGKWYGSLDHFRCPCRRTNLGVVPASQVQQAPPGEGVGLLREITGPLRLLPVEILVHSSAPKAMVKKAL
jgi:hypothetical protein